MFYGEFVHTLDEKNRLIVPMRLRGKIKETFVERFIITKGLDNCLFLFTKNEWKLFENKTKALPLTGKDARAYTRHLFSGASECAIDKQGKDINPFVFEELCSNRKGRYCHRSYEPHRDLEQRKVDILFKKHRKICQ